MTDLFTYAEARDAAMLRVERNAGEQFREQAQAFVVDYLTRHSQASGEEITTACESAGIQAHDSRAMGPVIMTLARRGTIEKCGTAIRTKGHGTSGANLWRLTTH